jgi:hypothetical protein
MRHVWRDTRHTKESGGGVACDWEETIKGASLAGNYGYETRTEISGGYVIMSEGRSW